MRKIINKKVYDTDKAKLIYQFVENNFDHYIYKKRTGEYFMYTFGYTPFNELCEVISPVAISTVKGLLHEDKKAYDSEFSFSDDEKEILSLVVKKQNSLKLREFASNRGISLSEAFNFMFENFIS